MGARRIAGPGIALALILSVLLMAMTNLAALAATQVDVTRASQVAEQWTFVRESGNPSDASGRFVTGPGSPLLGHGSAELRASTSSGGIFLGTNHSDFSGQPLAAITALRYSTYQQSGPATVAVALQFSIDYDGPGSTYTGWQGRLVYEPYNDSSAAVTLNTWQTWNTISSTAKWWASGAPGNTLCPQSAPCTWAQVKGYWSSATINSAPLTQVGFKIGQGVSPSFVGNVDRLVVKIGGTTPVDKVYDFEDSPATDVTPTTAAGLNWDFEQEGNPAHASGQFVVGPGTPPLGNGSAELAVSNSDGAMFFRTHSTDFAGKRLADIIAMSYSTYQQTASASVASSLQFSIDYDGPGSLYTGWQGRLTYEPYNNLAPTDPVSIGSWQTWDTLASNARWWASKPPGDTLCPQSAPCTWAQVLSYWPNAEIKSNDPQLGFKVGSGLGSPFVGNVDNLAIVIGGLSPVDRFFNFDQVPQCTNVCYVDAATGNDYTKGGTSAADAKKTIQAAVNAVSNNGRVIVAPGTYPERVVINKKVRLEGPNLGVNPNDTSTPRGAEAMIVPPANNYDGYLVSSSLITLGADGIIIDGLTLNGDNTAISGGASVNGADINVYYGIVNNFVDYDFDILAYANNTTIRNNILKNLGEGVDLYATAGLSTGTVINRNNFDNMGSAEDGHRGILLGDDFYADVKNNVMTRVYIGIQTNNFYQTGSGYTFSGNDIASYAVGMLHNLQYHNATTATISNNTFTAADTATWSAPGAWSGNRNFGILLWSIQETVGVTLTGNVATGNDIGIAGWNLTTSNTVTISGGTLRNNNYGVQLYTCDQDYGVAGASNLIVDGTTIRNSVVAALAVLDNPGAKASCASGTQPAHLTGQDLTIVSAASADTAAGALSDGPQASLTLTRSSVTFHSVGLKVTGSGTLSASSNLITDNDTGLSVDTGSTLQVTANAIVGNDTGAVATGSPAVASSAENNWWGCNEGPGASGSECNLVSGTLDYNPWLVLSITRTPTSDPVLTNTALTVTADLSLNSLGGSGTGGGYLPGSIEASFTRTPGSAGSFGTTPVPLTNNKATTTFTTGTTEGLATLSAQVHEEIVSLSFNIGRLATTVTADDKTATYNGTVTLTAAVARTDNSAPVNGVTVAFTVDSVAVCGSMPLPACPTTVAGVATLSGVSLVGLNVGDHTIGASFAGDGTYSPGSDTATLSIGKASQTITFPHPGNPTYGSAALPLNATASSGLTVSYAVTNGGPCTIVSGPALQIDGAGSCVVEASQAGDSNYFVATPVSQTVTIGRAPLTLRAANASIQFGQAVPCSVAPVAPNGFVNGDDLTDLSGTLACTTTPSPIVNTGTFPIIPSGLSSPNYTITFQNSTLSVAKCPVALTLTSQPAGPIQYSDLLTLVAHVTTCGGPVIPSGPIQFSLGGSGIGTATFNASGDASFTTIVTRAPGSYAISAVYGSADSRFIGASASGTLTVAAEEATAAYTGTPTTFPVNNVTKKGTVQLKARISDSSVTNSLDTAPGDIRTARVRFALPNGSAVNAACDNVVVTLVSPSDQKVGDAACSFQSAAATYTIKVVVLGNYTGESPAPPTTIIVGNGGANLVPAAPLARGAGSQLLAVRREDA